MWLTIAIIFAVTTVYGILLAIYRLTLHPLARFPGPKLAAATKWWEFYQDIFLEHGGLYASEIERMHDRYGPIVRINPHEIHVRDPEWIETLYPGSGQKRDKYPPAANMVGTPLGTFGTVLHDQHRRRRAAIAPFYSKRSISQLQPILHKNIDLFCARLDQHMATDRPVDIRVDYLAYSSEGVCNTAFGSSLNLLEDYDRAEDWHKTLAALSFITPVGKQFPWMVALAFKLPHAVLNMISPDIARMLKLRRDMNVRAAKAIRDNATGSDRVKSRVPTIFENILSSSLPPEEKEEERMAQEGFVNIVAGSETVSRVLSLATFHILDNAWVLNRLKEELTTALPDMNGPQSLEMLEKLPWLTAVIKETLRISALITSRSPMVAPDRDLYYKDWRLPAGTPVSMTLSTILMDPTIFSEPYIFNPSRWLDGHPEAARSNHFMVAFNRGSRMCIGLNFAWAEMYLILASVFRRYELQLYNTNRKRDVDYKYDCFLGEPGRESKGVRVKVAQRYAK